MLNIQLGTFSYKLNRWWSWLVSHSPPLVIWCQNWVWQPSWDRRPSTHCWLPSTRPSMVSYSKLIPEATVRFGRIRMCLLSFLTELLVLCSLSISHSWHIHSHCFCSWNIKCANCSFYIGNYTCPTCKGTYNEDTASINCISIRLMQWYKN